MNILLPITYNLEFVNKVIAKFIKDIKIKLLIADFTLLDMWIQVEFGLDKKITSKKIIEFALKHLEIVIGTTNYVIQFNPIIYYPGTSTRLITLLKTINYGTRHFKGNSLLIDEFKQLDMNIDNLYNQYRLIGVVI